MNFRIIDGNNDYMQKLPEFIELYNANYVTIPVLCKKLGITTNQYRKLRKHCKDEGLIKLRRNENKKKRSP